MRRIKFVCVYFVPNCVACSAITYQIQMLILVLICSGMPMFLPKLLIFFVMENINYYYYF
jgi:hypothetical protein